MKEAILLIDSTIERLREEIKELDPTGKALNFKTVALKCRKAQQIFCLIFTKALLKGELSEFSSRNK